MCVCVHRKGVLAFKNDMRKKERRKVFYDYIKQNFHTRWSPASPTYEEHKSAAAKPSDLFYWFTESS